MADSPPGSDTPDWDSLAIELRCPCCAYDLRRLPQPRCPECGLQFRWAELIAAAEHQRKSPLFEYQWRRRPVRSFFGTIGRTMLPWMLWRDTPLALEPHWGPLLVFVSLMLLLYAGVCLSADYGCTVFVNWWYVTRSGWAAFPFGITSLVSVHLFVLLGALVLAVLTGAVLQVFQQTINRYRIRWQHFLRILVLAGTGHLMWRAAMVVLLCTYDIFATCASSWMWRPFRWVGYVSWLAWLADLVPISVFALAVSAGLGGYLRVRRGWSMGFVSTLIVLLLLVTSVLALTVLFGRPDNFGLRVLGALWPGLGDLVWYWLVH